MDAELGATALMPDQLKSSRIYVYLIKRKCVAAAVVSRIEEAFVVLPNGQEDALRFGDDGAVFASYVCRILSRDVRRPAPVKAIAGVHRIWTARSARRRGLGTKMLDTIAHHWLYGGQRLTARDLAFSQPTQAGAALARSWTQSSAGWLVFDI